MGSAVTTLTMCHGYNWLTMIKIIWQKMKAFFHAVNSAGARMEAVAEIRKEQEASLGPKIGSKMDW